MARSVELAELDDDLDRCVIAILELGEKVTLVQVSDSKCWLFYNKRLPVSLSD